MPRLRLEILELTKNQDLDRLQSILVSCSEYWKTIDAHISNEGVLNLFLSHERSGNSEKKIIYGFRIGQELIGAVSLIKNDEKIRLEHLLIRESYRRCGFGSEAYQIIEKLIKSWDEKEKFVDANIRKDNLTGAAFLRKLGFEHAVSDSEEVRDKVIITYIKSLR